MRVRYVILLFALGCGSNEIGSTDRTAKPSDTDSGTNVFEEDAATAPTELDAGAEPVVTDAGSDATVLGGVAPEGAIAGEVAIIGEIEFSARAGEEKIFRIEANPTEHVHFWLEFSAGDPVMAIDRWNGERALDIGYTDAGDGFRTLAVFDSTTTRTFWVHIQNPSAFDGVLTVTRTAFEDGPECESDCARRLQLPLPNDPFADGYDWDAGTIMRYQFGRRDLVMFIRQAGLQMATLGYDAFFVHDLSQWDDDTPGNDVGAPRHVSHRRGIDVDIALYNTQGVSSWDSLCSVSGTECASGSMSGFDGLANALMFAPFLESGRVTMSFLDEELIPYLIEGADEGAGDGLIDPSVLPDFSDGHHVQHWPHHHDHIHIRVAE